MKKLLIACALAALAAGCRTPHLGDSTGEAYRGALNAQRDSDAEAPAGLDATDAHTVLNKHRKGGGKDDRGTGGMSTPTTTTSSAGGSTSGGAGGQWPGATGGIVLEAK